MLGNTEKKGSPKLTPSGFEEEFPKRPETQTMAFSYNIFRLLARPEEHLSKMIALYYYEKSRAAGAVRFFVSAAVVGGDKATVVPSAAWLQKAKHTERPKEDIVRAKRERKLIVRLKTVVE